MTVSSPFPHYALPRVWGWIGESRRQTQDDFSVDTLNAFVGEWEAADAAGRSTWAVWRDGELGGAVTSRRINPACADAHCIFKRSFWGHETTAQALQLVFKEVFADGVLKITAWAYYDNHALLGLVRKLGFQKEGVLRKQTRRKGEMIDVVLIGLTKEDFRFAPSNEVEKQEAAVV